MRCLPHEHSFPALRGTARCSVVLLGSLVSAGLLTAAGSGVVLAQTKTPPPTQPVPQSRPIADPDAAAPAAAAPAMDPVQAHFDESSAPAAPAAKATDTPQPGPPLSRDECILQVLNRFTYGPRPGDLEHIRAIGIGRWLTEQLNPWKIDDSALEQMLATNYPAMQLPLARLVEMYPNDETIRALRDGRVGVPNGEGERAIYNAQQARYEQKRSGKDPQAGQMRSAAATPAPLPVDPAAVLAMAPEDRFKTLTRLTPLDLRDLRQALPQPQRMQLTQGLTPHQLEVLAAEANPAGLVSSELVQTKLLRDIYSERQLTEVMVDFWLNHFNVYMKKSQDAPYLITAFERDTIRRYALGHFENLLVATAESPAMLNYLDNASSIGPHSGFASPLLYGRFARQGNKQESGLNENYARELMELHTLGVNGGYTQRDVTEVAKVFTGWTVGRPMGMSGGVATQAQFDPTKHEPGTKTVLGVKIKDGGEHEGMEVLHMLATSPQTAHFISAKLAVRFVSDTPPPAMIERMAKTYMDTQGDIRMVLLTMIQSPEFFARANYRAKVKTPQDYVVSAVRASGAKVETAGALEGTMTELGMPVFGMQTPQGYSMRADAWNNTAALISRMNFALALSSNRVAGVRVDWPATLAVPDRQPAQAAPVLVAASPGPAAPDAQAPRPLQLSTLDAGQKDLLLEEHILHIPVSDRTRQTILTQITADPRQQRALLNQVNSRNAGDPLSALRAGATPNPGVTDPQTALAAGLLFGSPEFQRR